ncbi:hypothetical protein DPMN_001716 [Dreissena polymorpha]|uniref:Uncharacterized protein n=1 Tax=Dreissena polymorpha TaxID=45954 RepID=A0A9D4MJV8_DREPO|nr:hypothetical protein DPMN_001716 [Dreissena polymorpha]
MDDTHTLLPRDASPPDMLSGYTLNDSLLYTICYARLHITSTAPNTWDPGHLSSFQREESLTE